MSKALVIELFNATWETLYMVGIASIIATIIGIPLGVCLFITRKHGLLPHKVFNRTLAAIINALRSIPFIILLVAIIPFTRFVVGTSIGTTAAIVPLSIGAFPFVARLVENSLNEIPIGLIEAGQAMGASLWQIIYKILLPEAAASIVNGVTLMVIALIGYSAMAGVVGGGGLGDLAIRYGYQRFDTRIMLITVIILIIMVQLIQVAGDFCTRKLDKR